MATWLYFDLETTAPEGFDARDPEHAIPVQAALGTHESTTGRTERVQNFPLLINPGVPISTESAEIHGITDTDVANATPLGEALETIADHINRAVHHAVPIVGMNLAYDFTVLDRRLRAHNLPTLGERGPNPRPGTTHDPAMIVLDVSVIERWADQYRSGSRKLIDLCERYGVPLTNAHDADADAAASAHLLSALVDVAHTCADHNPDELARNRRNTVHVPANPATGRGPLILELTTAPRFASMTTMSTQNLMTGQRMWRAEFIDFVTKGTAPTHHTWPVHQIPATT